MDLNNLLTRFKTKFDLEFASFFEKELESVAKINPTATELLEHLRDLCLGGGKRLRPFLAYLGYYLVKGDLDDEINPEIIKLGIALELFQTIALVHDDIIDEATHRRGLPTIQTTYESKLAGKFAHYKHLALSSSILAGDVAYSLSNKAFSKVKMENKDQLEGYFWRMQTEVCYGQVDDTLGVGLAELKMLSRETVLNMLDYKSGRYSIEKPLLLGAILAGKNPEELDNLSTAGIKLGIAFQLADDILGIFGDEKVTGKSSGGDLVEGKRTLLLLETYNALSNSDQNTLNNILNSDKINGLELAWFREKCKQTGVYDTTKNYAQELVNDSKQILINSNLKKDTSFKILLELADFLVSRAF